MLATKNTNECREKKLANKYTKLINKYTNTKNIIKIQNRF